MYVCTYVEVSLLLYTITPSPPLPSPLFHSYPLPFPLLYPPSPPISSSSLLFPPPPLPFPPFLLLSSLLPSHLLPLSPGSSAVDWLFSHVEGFIDRRHSKRYASLMLKDGYIKHTVNKISFSEQCYYVFGDVYATTKPQYKDLQKGV